MIGTTSATVLFLLNVLFASVLGVGAGGITCLVLRRPWGVKDFLIDAALAAVVAVIAAYVVSAVEATRGIWESRVALILAIAVASVVVRHLIRLALRSAN
jgi:hypothetical protein